MQHPNHEMRGTQMNIFGIRDKNNTETMAPQYFINIKKFAYSESIILLTGETGVGKSYLAKKIVELSKRSKEAYQEINCGIYRNGTLESQLFGHKKGSFTDAKGDHKGIFELVNKGTLFLDEICETTEEFQISLLKVLDNNAIRYLGGNKDIPIDVRLIFATNKNLAEEIDNKRFREDLFFRIKTFMLDIPPLRERKSEILKIAKFFLEKFCIKNQKNINKLASEVRDIMLNYSWPGNIRELEKVIEHAVVMAENSVILLEDLPLDIRKNQTRSIYLSPTSSLQADLKNEKNKSNFLMNQGNDDLTNKKYSLVKKEFEAFYLENLLANTNGHIKKMVEISGIDRKNIDKKLKKHNLNREIYKKKK